MTAATGDLWLSATNPTAPFSPAIINPAETGTMTFTPSGASGTVVKGTPYIDTFDSAVPAPAYSQHGGDEFAAITKTRELR